MGNHLPDDLYSQEQLPDLTFMSEGIKDTIDRGMERGRENNLRE